MNTIYLLLLIPAARFLINLNNWYFMYRVMSNHEEYTSIFGNDKKEEIKQKSEKAAVWITSNLTDIKERVEKAGIQNPIRQVMENAGYGHVAPTSFTTLDNMLFQNTEILKEVRYLITMAKGYYWSQMIKSINPIFWLEIVFFLPKSILSASGIESSNKIADIALKAVQVIYWLAVVWVLIFKPEIFLLLIGHTNA